MSAKYVPSEIESKWQQVWAKEQTFRVSNPGDPGFDASKKKYYILDMFPYPSGAGLHVGHPEGYTATDILARFRRMQGWNVLHPMGWDAFGLPAEQYAMQTGTHPAVTTQGNVDSFRATLQRLGFSYDWSREVNTTDPKYYRWTQWIFLKIFNSVFDTKQNRARDVRDVVNDLNAGKIGLKPSTVSASSSGYALLFDKTAAEAQAFGKQWRDLDADQQWRVLADHRLAYICDAPVWWCEQLGTVLANEEVIDGRSERGDFPCERRPLRQWMMRITSYAQRLLDDLDTLDWPEPIKLMQRHWVGQSEGAEVDFEVVGPASVPAGRDAGPTKIRVFTTRPDTLYGATYMVLAPEHPLVKQLTTPEHIAAVEKYVQEASRKSDLARTDLAKEKSGVFIGAYAYNPVYDKGDPHAKIPIWIADYVLMGYGTGAIMAVPAHDERDAEFAVKFELPIVSVVMPPDAWLKDNAKQPSKDVKALREQFRNAPTAFKAFFVDDGTSFNSPIFDNLPTPEAKKKITCWLEEKKLGEGKITYRLRDWLFSRQRYWGEPFPIVWDDKGHARPIAEDTLPVALPEMSDYKPSGTPEPPLSKAKDWVNVQIEIEPDGTARVVGRASVPVAHQAISPSSSVLETYRRHLPHWRVQGATYFVTWSVRKGEADLTPDERGCVVDALKHFDAQRYDLFAYVVMNDHVHVLVRPREGLRLEQILHTWKSYTANQLQRSFKRQGAVWMEESFDRVIRDEAELLEKASYIEKNAFRRWPPIETYEWVGFPFLERESASSTGTEARPTSGRRETNTMPQWAGSCWYYLRYLDAGNDTGIFRNEAEKYWMNVDLYVGGAEHAVLHLLYSRFWHKVLFDLGVVSTKEPFQKLFNQGLIQAFVYEDPTGRLVPNDEVEEKQEGVFIHKPTGAKLRQLVGKMSKSLKNVIPADDVVAQYGADTLRLYEMFLGPLEASKPWNPRDVPGVFRFLRDAWRMIVIDDESKPDAGGLRPNLKTAGKFDQEVERELHKAIKGVTHDLERMAFNTAISKLMIFRNKALEDVSKLSRSQAERFVLLLAPLAPHLAEELWSKLGHTKTLAYENWPAFDEALTQDATKEIAVQVNGKLRARIVVPANVPEADLKAQAQEAAKADTGGKQIVKVIVVPGRLVNIVVKG